MVFVGFVWMQFIRLHQCVVLAIPSSHYIVSECRSVSVILESFRRMGRSSIPTSEKHLLSSSQVGIFDQMQKKLVNLVNDTRYLCACWNMQVVEKSSRDGMQALMVTSKFLTLILITLFNMYILLFFNCKFFYLNSTGMRVGEKRKLTIPPSMGYKSSWSQSACFLDCDCFVSKLLMGCDSQVRFSRCWWPDSS